MPIDARFDPHKNRKRSVDTISTWKAYVLVINAAIHSPLTGSGQYMQLHKTGILINLLVYTLSSLLLIYGIRKVLKNIYNICRAEEEGYLHFEEAIHLAFSRGPKFLVKYATCTWILIVLMKFIIHYFMLCIYFHQISKSCHDLVATWNVHTISFLNMKILALPYFCIIFCFRTLKQMTYTSLISVVAYVGFYIISLYYTFAEFDRPAECLKVGTFEKFQDYFAYTLFSYMAFSTVRLVEREMESPKKFVKLFGVLNIAFVFGFVAEIVHSTIRYWRNGRPFPEEFGTLRNNLLNVFTALASYTCFPLQGHPIICTIWRDIFRACFPSRFAINIEMILRPLVVVLVFIFVLFVTEKQILIISSAFSGTCLALLTVTIPSFFELLVLYPNSYGKFKYKLVENVALIFVGVSISFSFVVWGFQRSLSKESNVSGSNFTDNKILNQWYMSQFYLRRGFLMRTY